MDTALKEETHDGDDFGIEGATSSRHHPRDRADITDAPFISQIAVSPTPSRQTMSLFPSPSKSPMPTPSHNSAKEIADLRADGTRM
jgi:hypothetical protein